jgi:hypothetical protein
MRRGQSCAFFGNIWKVPSFLHAQTGVTEISITAQGGGDVTLLGKDAAPVQFKLSGGAHAGTGVYLDGNAIAKLLSLDKDITLNMPANAKKHYTVIQCGFDVSASASGKVALGVAGSVTFGVDASADANYAVVQLFNHGAQPGLVELTSVANQWKLPANVAQVGDDKGLDPGTWVLAEVDGSLDLKLGAQYGFDYNWVRTIKAGGLSGDVGLKLNLGISAALGLSCSGTFVIVAGRETAARVVRLQIFRRSNRGSSFSFNAGADFQPVVPLPCTADDFVKAIFGTHGAQVLQDLQVLKNWDGTSGSLSKLLADAGVDRVMKLIKDITGVDPATAFGEAQAKLTHFLDQWNNLDHNIASRVLQFVADNKDLSDVKTVAGLISSDNQSKFRSFLEDKLKDVAFFQSPLGQYLEILTSQGLVSLLDTTEFANVKKGAADTLAVLDGSDVETILKNIQNKIVSALDLKWLIDDATKIDQTTFASLDALLKAKLAAFLDKEIPAVVVDDLKAIAKTISGLYENWTTFYARAKDALNRKYGFNFAATYQGSTSNTALLDISLDFDQGDHDTLSRTLAAAIDGSLDLNAILVNRVKGVLINKGRLTHEIKRQSHAEFNMPFLSASSDNLITATAGMITADTQDGRMFGYDLQAQNHHQAQVAARFRRTSTLSAAASIQVPAGSPLRAFSVNSMTCSYKFQQIMDAMTVKAFESQVGSYLDAFFLPTLAAGHKKREDWLAEIEKKADPSGVATLGNTVLTLEVDVPAQVTAVWMGPATENEDLLPGALLNAMRILIPYSYLSDLRRFNDAGFGVFALLFYQAVDLTGMHFGDAGPETVSRVIARATNNDVDDDNSPLGEVLNHWCARLKDAGGPKTGYYTNTRVNRRAMVDIVQETSAALETLLIGTANALTEVQAARKAILTFRANASLNPKNAITALTRFGDGLVSGFGQLSSIYGDDLLRALGTLAFTATAQALSGKPAMVNALLDVAVVNVDPLKAQLPDSGPSPSQIISGNRLLAVDVEAQLPKMVTPPAPALRPH